MKDIDAFIKLPDIPGKMILFLKKNRLKVHCIFHERWKLIYWHYSFKSAVLVPHPKYSKDSNTSKRSG